MPDLTPSELLAATAADMRALADAASDAPWSAGYWHEGEFLYQYGNYGWYVTGPCGSPEVEDSEQGKADVQHIAAWDPDMARAIADWLDAKAVRYADRAWAMRLLNDIAAGSSPPMLRVCDAWWKSRGIDPQVKEQQ